MGEGRGGKSWKTCMWYVVIGDAAPRDELLKSHYIVLNVERGSGAVCNQCG